MTVFVHASTMWAICVRLWTGTKVVRKRKGKRRAKRYSLIILSIRHILVLVFSNVIRMHIYLLLQKKGKKGKKGKKEKDLTPDRYECFP